MKVNIQDLFQYHSSISKELNEKIDSLIKNSNFIQGAEVEEFEKEFALKIGAKHCVSCANGTDAIYIALKALNLKPGDEVIVPAISWISTSEAVTQAGGKPIFCDVDKVLFTIDCNQIEQKITKKTKGIIPVHLYGQATDMLKVCSIAKKHKLWIIEDCAQAHLSSMNEKCVGTWGDVGTFSFYPGKNLGAFGDAGAIITNDKSLEKKMRMFARHGGLKKHEHLIEGINSRLDTIQAAILRIKLKDLEKMTSSREELANFYKSELEEIHQISLPTKLEGSRHVWHLFTILTNKRNKLIEFFQKKNIGFAINYPVPLPLLPCYKHLGFSEVDFPNASEICNTLICIPMYPNMPEDKKEYVVNSLKEFFN